MIRTRAATDQYRTGWDRTFGKKSKVPKVAPIDLEAAGLRWERNVPSVRRGWLATIRYGAAAPDRAGALTIASRQPWGWFAKSEQTRLAWAMER